MRARRLIACVILAAAACAPHRPPRPPLAPTVPPALVREASLGNGFVTARIALPENATHPVPAVISYIGEADALRAHGLAVVTYVIHWEKLAWMNQRRREPAPGERTYGQWLLATTEPNLIGQSYFRLIAGDAERTVPQVLDWVTTLPEIDGRRIGIVGASTYGFVALQAAVDPRIAAAASLAACGDYHRFLHLSTLGMNGEALGLEPEYDEWLHEREPIRRPERLVHAAVLMVNGADDVAVPAVCAEETAGALRRAYARAGVAERYRFVLVEAAGHDVSAEARYQTLAWFWRWLVEPGR